ncbi:oxidoreductase [Coprinopsis cinerea okayama7|uniref:Oxidoreductase n=1 Tax=Coprinopsis cinerea (strain Okayama-7 / 130 / ATCC MYA-4618 / FGSC 9003) TaxID=240176 RepID=A8PCB3_COPC7|nr:oxidoreductase [Coprinopsis cinerea okayama7\|eukprot:XP_001840356.1 oxidoreductase [Coprinopsis cinerea okayama7\
MPSALIIGASRGLGLELAKQLGSDPAYASLNGRVFATVRSASFDASTFPSSVTTIPEVDLNDPNKAGTRIVEALKKEGIASLDLVIINAGVFIAETLDEPDYEAELEMYKVVAIAPVFLAHHLHKANLFSNPSKLVLITTEGGSITLRTKEEGGQNYGHHGSKAAANMVGKLLSFDLEGDGVTVVMIHPGFMRTDMTKGVGYDKHWDSGGAVYPSEAAKSLIDFVATVDASKSGTFWAPRGPRDIGEAERVLGKNLPTPLQLPW